MNKEQILASATLEILNDVYVFGNATQTIDNIKSKIAHSNEDKTRLDLSLLSNIYSSNENDNDVMHEVVTEINKASRILYDNV